MCCNGTHFCGKIGSDLIPDGLQGKYAAKKLPGFRQSGGQIRENFLYRDHRIVLLNMTSFYTSEEYKQKVAAGMRAMLNSDGPVYIHCMEGKDRTGFVCFLLEALAGASYDEMCSDYMKTYENYYGVTGNETPEKYRAIVDVYFDPFAVCLHRTENIEELKTADYVQDAENYLIAGGMTQPEIEQLKALITK